MWVVIEVCPTQKAMGTERNERPVPSVTALASYLRVFAVNDVPDGAVYIGMFGAPLAAILGRAVIAPAPTAIHVRGMTEVGAAPSKRDTG